MAKLDYPVVAETGMRRNDIMIQVLGSVTVASPSSDSASSAATISPGRQKNLLDREWISPPISLNLIFGAHDRRYQ